METININIWDDFYDDEHIPDGEIQQTYIYIEENETDISHEKQKDCLEFLLKHISENLKTSGVKLWIELYDSRKKYPHLNEIDDPFFMKAHPNFHFSRWEIKIENLTHEQLYKWEEHFESAFLFYDKIPLNIYSES